MTLISLACLYADRLGQFRNLLDWVGIQTTLSPLPASAGRVSSLLYRDP